MTSKQQKKFQKKKERERRVHKQILAKREELRQPEREERKFNQKLKRITKLKKDMGKLNVWADEVFLNMSEKNLSQLERNTKILKALEDEYQDEHDKKKKINAELEAKGLVTLEEKLDHLHNKLVEQAKTMYKDAGLEAKEKKSVEEMSMVEQEDQVLDALFETTTAGFAPFEV